MSRIYIEINADSFHIPPVLSFIEEYAKIKNFSENDIKKIKIATEESITNIIRHSYKNNKEEIIHIEIVFEDNVLKIKLKHKGEKFDLRDKSINIDISKILKERKKGGFGLFIIKKFMDDFEIGKEGQWNFYLLKKKLN